MAEKSNAQNIIVHNTPDGEASVIKNYLSTASDGKDYNITFKDIHNAN